MKILFICKGNVGRSQMAEALLRKLIPNKIDVISAGIKISGPEQPIGELMPQIKEVLDVMKEENIDVSSYIRKQLTEEMVNDSDKIITIIENSEPIPEYLSKSTKMIRWDVPDPKGMNLSDTRKIKNQIKLILQDFIKSLNF